MQAGASKVQRGAWDEISLQQAVFGYTSTSQGPYYTFSANGTTTINASGVSSWSGGTASGHYVVTLASGLRSTIQGLLDGYNHTGAAGFLPNVAGTISGLNFQCSPLISTGCLLPGSWFLPDYPVIASTGGLTVTTNLTYLASATVLSATTSYVTALGTVYSYFGMSKATNMSAYLGFYNAQPNYTQDRLDIGFYGVSPMLSFRADGGIGVGTTAPQATLDINGYARLKMNSTAPATCASTNQGAVALTSIGRMCVCNGGGTPVWSLTSDGVTACSW